MRKVFVLLVSVLCFFCQASAQEKADSKSTQISYFEIRKLIDDGIVERGQIYNDGWWVAVYTSDGNSYYAQITPQTPIADHLYAAGVPVSIDHIAEEVDKTPLWLEVFFNLLPLLIFILFFAGIMFFMKRGGGDYYARAEKINLDFLNRLEKLLIEREKENG